MDSIKIALKKPFADAIKSVFGPDLGIDPMIEPSRVAGYGDYQANFSMDVARRLRRSPIEVAESVLKKLPACTDIWHKLDISGPGFINVHLADNFLVDRVNLLAADARLGVPRNMQTETVVVDYGGQNIAKELHVGHLRSLIIGDAIVRLLEFQGHRVIRQNHVGDWGVQFGMVIQYLMDEHYTIREETIASIDQIYKQAKILFDSDDDFAMRAKNRVVALQKGDADTAAIWDHLVKVSNRHIDVISRRLGVLLNTDDVRGESFYNQFLEDTVRDIEQKGLAQEENGAVIVLLPEFVDRDNKILPLVIRKTEGAFLYATTDIAAARYRIETLKANRLIYVTDTRQTLHFKMIFSLLRKAGFAPDHVRLEHASFGTVLGNDRKPFKTRSGETIKLEALLDEAEKRSQDVLVSKNPSMDTETMKKNAQLIGPGSLKYADLKNERSKDYLFDWNRMISFEGNTAPYLLNAYVRIHSLHRKSGKTISESISAQIRIIENEERWLVLKLIEFPEAISASADELAPHKLCNALYELAGSYHKFYEQCPILNSGDPQMTASRLALSAVVANVLKLGMDLLGLQAMDKM